jgi:hypothetical protein
VPSFDDLWSKAMVAKVNGHDIRVASRSDLKRMKKAAGRPQDLIDLLTLKVMADEMHLLNLEDPGIRQLMLEEVDQDLSRGELYRSRYFTKDGADAYPDLLKLMIKDRSPGLFVEALEHPSFFRQELNGRRVPSSAARMFGEAEFNRYYIRAVCIEALRRGQSAVTIYRAKDTDEHRDKSDRLVAKEIDAEFLLHDMRTSQGKKTKSGLLGPNSGLSVHL